jgi:hypothetical protein
MVSMYKFITEIDHRHFLIMLLYIKCATTVLCSHAEKHTFHVELCSITSRTSLQGYKSRMTVKSIMRYNWRKVLLRKNIALLSIIVV